MRGVTPVLVQRTTHRDKVSAVASLWKTPGTGQARLHCLLYPNAHITTEDYADYLADLLRERLWRRPVIVIHDQGSMHAGQALEELLEDHPLLQVEPLPPYAPELNPVEALWNHLKCDRLANFAPHDAQELSAVLSQYLGSIHHDQARLRTFLAAPPLHW